MRSVLVRVVALLAVVALAGIAATRLLDHGEPRLAPGSGFAPGQDDERVDPLAYTPAREDALVAAAARGNAHVIYAKSPGGVIASAGRTARYRPLVERAADGSGFAADMLEAIVLLESAGRPAAVADPRLEGAVGLTQIVAQTGRDLLGLRVDPAGARSLGRSILRARRKDDPELVARLRARRRRIDERFDPPKALAATVRYLTIARGELARDDLAVQSYHMGIGNLQSALRAYGEGDVSYPRLYFDSSPTSHAGAWERIARLGDDSATYLWRVLAAREIMRLYRSDRPELERLSALHGAKNSAEEVLHPREQTERFATPAQLRDAYDRGDVVALPREQLAGDGVRIDAQMGELAERLERRPATYRGLRPGALALLVVLATGVRDISGEEPLIVTSSVRDERYQRLLVQDNGEATRNYSLHTTGWAFDVLRRYRSRAQAQAFEFMLGRLQSLDLIAWVREPAAIHVTASSRAESLLGALDTGG